MLGYGTQKRIVFASLVLYALFGFYLRTTPSEESYPIFSWALFSGIPTERYTYTIALVSAGGTTYDTPLPFSEMRPFFDAIDQSPTQYSLIIRTLGEAIERRDALAAEEQGERLEHIFPPGPYEYILFKVRSNPIEHWKTGAYREQQELVRVSGVRDEL